MLTLDRIYHAAYVLQNVIRRTDLIHAPKLNPASNIYLKPENLQLTGSFKIRGSYYKISQLSDEEKAKGVIACSAGNHAQGVALGATKNGLKSIIAHLGGENFPRIKIGVGKKPSPDYDLVNFVLGRFSKEDIALLEGAYPAIYSATELMLAGKIDEAMNKYSK